MAAVSASRMISETLETWDTWNSSNVQQCAVLSCGTRWVAAIEAAVSAERTLIA